MAEELRDKHSLLIELNALVEGGGDPLAVQIRDIPGLRLAGTIRHLRLVDPKGIDEMLQLAWKRLGELGIEPVEPPVALFRGGDGDGTHLVEVGFPVAQGIEGDDVLRVRRYAGTMAATVEHTGSYDGLHLTAQRFIASVLGEGLRPGQPIRIEFVQYHVLARIVWPLAAS